MSTQQANGASAKAKKRQKPKSGKARQPKISNKVYEAELFRLQTEFVKLQEWVRHSGARIVVIFEGRDAAGKGGTIKRITEYLSPRVARIAALPAPSDREQGQWYYQRYIAHLPARGEIVLFDRSWYNRAGVEKVMGFCTEREYERFLEDVLPFEHMLIGAGIQIIKYYLDISKKEQRKRLRARRIDPLTQWKTSPIDKVALKRFEAYTEARDRMLARTSSPLSSWIVVRADDKRAARLNLIRDLIARLACPETDKHLAFPDLGVVFPYDEAHAKAGLLAA